MIIYLSNKGYDPMPTGGVWGHVHQVELTLTFQWSRKLILAKKLQAATRKGRGQWEKQEKALERTQPWTPAGQEALGQRKWGHSKPGGKHPPGATWGPASPPALAPLITTKTLGKMQKQLPRL